MSGKVFRIDQAGEIGRFVAGGMEEAAKRAVYSAAIRLVSHIQTDVIPKEEPQPVDRGIYRAGWAAKRNAEGAEVSNPTPQAPIIEYGARAENIKAGPAMIRALAAWVVRKGIAGEKESRSVAYAIATAMKKRGIFNRNGKSGLRILDKGLAALGNFVNDEYAAELRRTFGGR